MFRSFLETCMATASYSVSPKRAFIMPCMLILITPLVLRSGSLIALTSLSSFCSYRVVLDLHSLAPALRPVHWWLVPTPQPLGFPAQVLALSADLVLLVLFPAPELIAQLVQTLA